MSGWTIHTLVSTTMLMALVMALRGPVAKAFGARTAYALWALPALRMILPPIPGWATLYMPVWHIGADETRIGLTDPAIAAAYAAPPPGPLPALPLDGVPPPPPGLFDQVDWLQLAGIVWLAGAALYFGWQMLRYHRFMARVLRGATLLTRQCGIDVLVTPEIDGPMAAGILKRRILLPADFGQRYTAQERRLALVHEGAHHDRLDIVANLAGLAMVALHWWNPIAHRAYRAFRADQELACDATVLAGASGSDRVAYGTAVVKSACTRTPAAACALNHKTQIKQRIRMMAPRSDSLVRMALGGTLALAAIGGGLALTATGSAAAPIVAPVAPDAPEPPAAPIAPSAPKAPAAPKAPEIRGKRIVHIVRRDGTSFTEVREATPEERRMALDAERDARRHADEARRAGMEAAREARQAGLEGAREARRAGAEAARAAHEAARAEHRTYAFAFTRPDPQVAARAAAQAEAGLARARASMRARCASQGVSLPAEADMQTLATCGPQLRRTVALSLQNARRSIEANSHMDPESRAEALRGIDQAMAEVERELASH